MGIDEVRDLINAAGYQMKFVPLSSSVDDAPELGSRLIKSTKR
jgi:hypothetical protein